MISSKVPFFDFNPVKEKIIDVFDLIEEVRNLQNNILNELRKPIINKDYIEECNSEIEKVISEITELNDKSS